MVLLFVLLPTTASADKVTLGTPRDVQINKVWDSQEGRLVSCEGYVSWKPAKPFVSSDQYVWWRIQIYRDGTLVGGHEMGWLPDYVEGVLNSNQYISYDLRPILQDWQSGTYFFTLQCSNRNSEATHNISNPARSADWIHTKPSGKLARPTNAKWAASSGYSLPEATWTENARGWSHRLEYYYCPTLDDEPQHIGAEWYVFGDSVAPYLDKGPGYYYFRVRTISGNLTSFSHSDWSEMSDTFHYKMEVPDFKVELNDYGQPVLSWTSVPYADYYEVERATSAYGSFTQLGRPNDTDFADINAQPGMTYYYRIRACRGNGAKSEYSDPVKFTMGKPLEILEQPKNVTVPNGQTATVTVKAAGDGLKYQWYYKDAGTSSFYASWNQTDTYSITMNSDEDGLQVYCKITDQYGASVTSNTVTLRMAADLVITQQPEKTVTVLSGETAKVTVKATGDGLKYQWFAKMPGSSSYVKGSQTGTTYSIAMNASRNGMKVCCKITDAYGRSVTSEVATLKQKTPLAITSQPVSVTVLPGETAKVTVKAAGDGLKYQWFVKMPGSSIYQKSSQTRTTYSVAMTAARNGMKVCCKITDKYGRSITSEVATLKQVTPLAITQQPKSVTVQNGTTAKVTVKATGEGLKYQWYVKMPTSSSFVKGSQTGSTYSVAMTAERNGMQVRCIVTDKYGKSVTSEAATLKLPTPLAITAQPVSVTVADGAAARVSIKAAGDGLTYQWFVKMPTASGYSKSSQTGTTYSVAMNASRNGMKVCCKVTDQYGNSITSNAVTLRMG